MAPRDPTRPKAADIDVHDLLQAVDAYAAGGAWITDAMPGYPAKVVFSKLHKMVAQGLVQEYAVGQHRKYILTPKGRETLAS